MKCWILVIMWWGKSWIKMKRGSEDEQVTAWIKYTFVDGRMRTRKFRISVMYRKVIDVDGHSELSQVGFWEQWNHSCGNRKWAVLGVHTKLARKSLEDSEANYDDSCMGSSWVLGRRNFLRNELYDQGSYSNSFMSWYCVTKEWCV